jgi:two-component system chemotaxis response regulator CheY
MKAQCVLVADDDPAIRLAVSLKLRSAGLEVVEATDGVEALDYVSKNEIDLAVLDVGMPRMDGFSVAKEMFQQGKTRGIPLIILTAQELGVPEEVAAEIGRHVFLMKPFSPRELIKVVSKLLVPVES